MFRFGQWSDDPLGADGLQVFHDEARSRLDNLSAAIVENTLRTFDTLRALWSPGGEFLARAVEADSDGSARSSEAAGVLLSAVPYMLSRERWEQRLRSEFADPSVLDHPVPLHNGVGRVFPLGLVLHSLDSGTGLELIDSVLACLLTKNAPVLLIMEADRCFASLFLRSLEIADARGPLASAVTLYCGREEALAALRSGIERYADATVDWRGAAASPRAAVSTNRRARAIHRSPPVLIGVISKAYWDSCDRRRISKALAAEFEASRRSAATSLRKLYVEADLTVDAELRALSQAVGRSLPSPIVLPYTDVGGLRLALEELSLPPTHCLCGLSADERLRYVGELGRSGLRRFIPFESYPERLDCRASDGALLRELVHVVTDERDGGVRELLREAGESVPFYRERRPAGDISDLERWPFLTGADLAEEPLHLSRKFLQQEVVAGSIFSSGGTSTAPKYALYTPPEIKRSADMLAHGFLANGLRPGDRVINLFIAGHLWSAFLAVDEALRRCGVYVLPMGGLSPIEEIVSCLSSFRPDVAFGLPSLVVGYARHCEDLRIDLTVKRIFYAGEHFNPSARDYVRRVWKTESFHSAGYAAVDVGAIGWQCALCQGGEHHLFSNDVHLEIVDEEAVVTSLVRRAMPMIRYRTGDRVEWIASECPCGSREPRFRLLGRVDGLINIWGCRVAYDDVERSLLEAGMKAPVLQLLIREKNDPSAQMEQLIVRMEQAELSPGFFDRLIANVHRYSRDISVALDVAALKERMVLECVPPNTIPRIARTGKVRLIVDERGSGQS